MTPKALSRDDAHIKEVITDVTQWIRMGDFHAAQAKHYAEQAQIHMSKAEEYSSKVKEYLLTKENK